MSTPFVGQDRHATVRRLIGEFHRCAGSAQPKWVDLEAPSGWGKTRIVQEFYRELCATQQDGVPYWPPTLSGAPVDGPASVLDDRKIIRPLVAHAPGSLPTFMWWGITCSRARGHHTTALANDLRQFVAHVPYLEDALTARKGRAVNLLAGGRRAARDLLDVGAEEAATLVLETLLSAAIPGLGLARPLARAVRGNAAERRQRRRRLDGSELIVEDGDELVLGAVSLIQRLTGPANLPCVIIVEDLHLADRELVALLEAVVALESAQVLILTTSWPGFVEENTHVAHAMATARDLGRFSGINDRSAQQDGSRLTALGDADLAELVQSIFPGTASSITDRIVRIAESPLALMLTLDLPRFARFRGGPLTIEPEDVPSGPSAIADIIRTTWQEMPEPARVSIGLAALSTPAAAPVERTSVRDLAATGLSHLDEWDVDLLTESIGLSSLPSLSVEASGQAADNYAWATSLSPSLRRFRDPLHFDIAAERVSEHLLSSEQAAFRKALGTAAIARWNGEPNATDRELLAHLIVGLAASGTPMPGDLIAQAGLQVVRPLQLEPTSWPDAVGFCDAVVAIINDPSLSAPLEVWRWRIAGEMGENVAAKRNLRRLVRDLQGTSDVLLLAEAKHHLAVALAQSGDVREALEVGEAALTVRRTHLGITAEPTLRSLMNVAWFLSLTGEHLAAERNLGDVSERAAQALGVAHPVTIAATIGWAAALAASDRRPTAVARLEALRRSVSGAIDSESPIALILDYNLLVARSSMMLPSEAQEALSGLADRARRTFGNIHPFIDEIEESTYEKTDDWNYFVQLMGIRSLG